MPTVQAFTTTSLGGFLNVLKNQCGVSQAYNPAGVGAVPHVAQFDAIWDTGATNSCVSDNAINACGLVPIGMAQVHGAHGVSTEPVFLVNIYLPNNVSFTGVRVTRATLSEAEILIGMDIINMGDFAVTNQGGVTKFSFREPSIEHIDFVTNIQRPTVAHGGSKKFRTKPPKGPGGKAK